MVLSAACDSFTADVVRLSEPESVGHGAMSLPYERERDADLIGVAVLDSEVWLWDGFYGRLRFERVIRHTAISSGVLAVDDAVRVARDLPTFAYGSSWLSSRSLNRYGPGTKALVYLRKSACGFRPVDIRIETPADIAARERAIRRFFAVFEAAEAADPVATYHALLVASDAPRGTLDHGAYWALYHQPSEHSLPALRAYVTRLVEAFPDASATDEVDAWVRELVQVFELRQGAPLHPMLIAALVQALPMMSREYRLHVYDVLRSNGRRMRDRDQIAQVRAWVLRDLGDVRIEQSEYDYQRVVYWLAAHPDMATIEILLHEQRNRTRMQAVAIAALNQASDTLGGAAKARAYASWVALLRAQPVRTRAEMDNRDWQGLRYLVSYLPPEPDDALRRDLAAIQRQHDGTWLGETLATYLAAATKSR
ncbi:MAG: hypothetical protein Tsb0020_20660 [Haliangiales bacterium]